MAADFTPEELASRAATPAWRALPATVARGEAVRAAVAGHRFDAAGLTAALQAFIALDQVDPIPDIHQALAQGLI
jgi:hypothetical protein